MRGSAHSISSTEQLQTLPHLSETGLRISRIRAESDSPFLPPCPSHSTYPHADPGRLGRPGRAEWVARGCSWEREESARTPSPQPQRKGPHEPELDPASWGCEVTLWAGLAAWHHLGPQDLVAPLLFVPAPWPLCPA